MPELCRDRGPGLVAIASVQVRASQAGGDAGQYQRADQTGAVAHQNREMRDAGGVQIAQHVARRIAGLLLHQQPRTGDAPRGIQPFFGEPFLACLSPRERLGT